MRECYLFFRVSRFNSTTGKERQEAYFGVGRCFCRREFDVGTAWYAPLGRWACIPSQFMAQESRVHAIIRLSYERHGASSVLFTSIQKPDGMSPFITFSDHVCDRRRQSMQRQDSFPPTPHMAMVSRDLFLSLIIGEFVECQGLRCPLIGCK